MTYVRTFVLVLALVMVGCASAPSAENGRSQRNANHITAEEIERAHYTDAYELVQALRPSWVQTRGTMSFQDPTAGQAVVYLAGTPLGRVEQLRIGDVASMQYLNGTEASARFGLDHVGGAILVHSKRGP